MALTETIGGLAPCKHDCYISTTGFDDSKTVASSNSHCETSHLQERSVDKPDILLLLAKSLAILPQGNQQNG